MQVKTRITNPTDSTQQYSWVPKYGILIGAKESVLLDGDIYTLTIPNPRLRQNIEEDERIGRVIIAILSDRKVEPLTEENMKKAVAVDEKPVLPPAPPIAKNAHSKYDSIFSADVHSKENILGGGIRELPEGDDGKGEIFNPFTGEGIGEGDLAKHATINMSDAMWKGDKTLEEIITNPDVAGDGKEIAVLTGPDVPKIYSQKDLMRMPVGILRKLAVSMGMPDVEDIKKAEIIKWILETQGNA